MNWIAAYGNILIICAKFPLYRPRKPSFTATPRKDDKTPEIKQKLLYQGPVVQN